MSEISELRNSLLASLLSFLFFASLVVLVGIKVNQRFNRIDEALRKGPTYYALQVEEVYHDPEHPGDCFVLRWEDYPHADRLGAKRDSTSFMQVYHHPEVYGFGSPFRGVPDTFYLTIVKI